MARELLTKEIFTSLRDELCGALKKEETATKRAITAEMQVAVILWYLADEGYYRKIVNALVISRGSISLIVRKVTTVILTLSGPKIHRASF